MNTAEDAGRSGHGTDGPSSTARQGHAASVTKPIPVATTCWGVVPPSPGSGKAATATEQTPPRSRHIRPAGRMRLSPYAVTK
ncbi:hypothetical protein ABH935_003528 [Catenulispora sp. GAS73]